MNVKRFPPRLPTLPRFKLPKIHLRKPQHHQVIKSNKIVTTKPPKTSYIDNNNKFNVMIAPGNDFELVTNNHIDDVEEDADDKLPEYALIVDITKDNLSQLNDSKDSDAKSIKPVGMKTVPVQIKEPEIIYGKPDNFAEADVVATAPIIRDNAQINHNIIKSSSEANKKPVYKAMKKPIEIATQDLQKGFLPSKQYASSENGEEVEEFSTPIIQSTFQQQTHPKTIITLKNQHFGRRPGFTFVQPRPLPDFRPPFEELRAVSSQQQLPRFQSQFEDVSPDFPSFFSQQFRDEFSFDGFPLSQVHPPSMINSLGSFSSDTNLVDSKLEIQSSFNEKIHFRCWTNQQLQFFQTHCIKEERSH